MSIIQVLRALGIPPSRLRRHSNAGHPKGDEFGRCASGAVCRNKYADGKAI